MASRRLVRLALRAKLMTLSVVTTGVTSISATATGFHRTAGSFLNDGFVVGMWCVPSGFANNIPGVVTGVTDTDLKVTLYSITYPSGVQAVSSPSVVVEAAASGRSVSVGLPAMREWENTVLVPIQGVPYVTEEYVPGACIKTTFGGPGGSILEWLPMYSPKIYVPSGVGSGVGDSYAEALVNLFYPSLSLPVTNATLIVRANPAPTSGQLLQSPPGFAVVPVNIPLELRTPN